LLVAQSSFLAHALPTPAGLSVPPPLLPAAGSSLPHAARPITVIAPASAHTFLLMSILT
jgi:hypothetical protein